MIETDEVLFASVKGTERTTHQRNSLTIQEQDKALTVTIRNVQRTKFKSEIQRMKQEQSVPSSKSLSGVLIFLGNDGVILVAGRLEVANLSYDDKHPMLLTYNDPITKMLMVLIHQALQEKIIALSIVQHCVKCVRAKPKLMQQVMVNLPVTRVHGHS